jgi:hypothetical protein
VSQPGPIPVLIRAVVGLVWLLIRLVLLFLTGEWVGKKPFEKADGQGEPGAQPGAARPPPAPKAPSPDQLARLNAWVVAADARVTELRKGARMAAGGAGLERLLTDVLAPQLSALRSELASGLPSKKIVERIQALDDALNALAESVAAHAEKRAGSLADSEAIAAGLVAPLYEHARGEDIALREREFEAVSQVDAARAQRISVHTPLLVVSDALGDASRLGWLVRSVARTLVEDLPALTTDLLREHRLPPGLFLPPPQGGYDADTVRGAIGVWLPELTADVLATFMVGPAYVRLLSAWLARPQAPLETRIGFAHGRWLSTQPPSALRLFAAARALQVLGFTEDAESIERSFAATHGPLDVLYYPLASGQVFAVPANFVLQELAPVLDALATEPLDALEDASLLDVPGFAYLHGEHARANDAALRFLRGEAVRHAARECAAGALSAVLARPDLNDQVFAALSRSVRGNGMLEALGTTATPALAVAPRSLHALARDTRELRAAMMLTSALGPRHGFIPVPLSRGRARVGQSSR